MTIQKSLLTLLFATFICFIGQASNLSATEDPENQDANADEIADWIKQLGSESLIERQKARENLTEAGQAAVPALAQAALSDERKIIELSIDVLGDITHKSEDEEAKEAAKITLEMLAESEQPSTADRAKLALDAEQGGGIQAFPGWDKPGSEFARGGGGVNRSVSVTNINGVKTITVKENGITTTLQDMAGGKIRVTVEGGEKPKQFVAQDLDDLKKKDESAFALYQQQANGGLAGFGGLGGFGNLGLGGNMQANGNAAQAGQINFAGANAAEVRQRIIQQLLDLKERMAGNPVMQEMLDEQIKQLGGK